MRCERTAQSQSRSVHPWPDLSPLSFTSSFSSFQIQNPKFRLRRLLHLFFDVQSSKFDVGSSKSTVHHPRFHRPPPKVPPSTTQGSTVHHPRFHGPPPKVPRSTTQGSTVRHPRFHGPPPKVPWSTTQGSMVHHPRFRCPPPKHPVCHCSATARQRFEKRVGLGRRAPPTFPREGGTILKRF